MNTKKPMARCSHRPATRIASLILSLAMLFTLTVGLDFSVFADASSGTCGKNVTWSFDENTGKLTISGNGPMDDYSSISSLPWNSYRSTIKFVEIEEGVTRIGGNAFSACSMTNVSIPSSVTSLGYDVFYACNILESIEVENDNLYYSSLDGVLFNKDKTKIECYPLGNERVSYKIPDTVTNIDGAFLDNRYLTSVMIPDSVVSIGNSSFCNCRNLTDITISNGVISIGDSAFLNCVNLTSIIIPDSVTSIGSGAFSNCNSLSSIIIPNSVKTIGDSAFSCCNSLSNIIIPDSITSIGNYLFYSCNNLVSVVIPDSVISIEEGAFSCCNSLKKILIPDSVISIGKDAFAWLNDVYYAGTEEQWNNISIGPYNIWLENSKIHYNCTSIPKFSFNDLNDYDYYNEFVNYTSVYNGFLKGTNSPEFTLFSPKMPITRAMLITILYRMAGEPYANGGNPYASSPFTDIKDKGAYYYDAACWALKNGITTETTFNPFNNVTREQTASFLFRYAKDNGKLGDSAYKNVNLATYPDYSSVHGWAAEAMQWANFNGMITGTQEGYINPQGATQRIHATKILYGFGKVCNIGNFE